MGGGRGRDELGQLGHQGLTKRQLGGFVWPVLGKTLQLGSFVLVQPGEKKRPESQNEETRAQTGDRDVK